MKLELIFQSILIFQIAPEKITRAAVHITIKGKDLNSTISYDYFQILEYSKHDFIYLNDLECDILLQIQDSRKLPYAYCDMVKRELRVKSYELRDTNY